MAKKFIALLAMIFILFATSAYAVDWYNAAWSYRKAVAVTNPSAGYVMSETQLTIYYNDGTKTGAGEVDCEGHCRTDFDDIRIAKSDGTTLLPYDVDSETDSDNMVITVTADTNPIYVYYGNSDAVVAYFTDGLLYATMEHQFSYAGAYDSTQDRVFITWANPGYDPCITYYDTAESAFAPRFWQPITTSSEDSHNIPSAITDGTYLHVAYGAHNDPIEYFRCNMSLIDVETSTDDFTTFTEVDPNSHISVAQTRVTFADIDRDEEAWVYTDAGVDFYDSNFSIEFSTKITAKVSGSYVVLCMLANDIDCMLDLAAASKSYLTISFYDSNGSTPAIYLEECDAGDRYFTAVGINVGTEYWLTFERNESVTTYGTAYLSIYSDAERLNLLSTLSLDLHSSTKDYRYRYALNTLQVSSGGYDVDGYVDTVSYGPLLFEKMPDIYAAGTYPMWGLTATTLYCSFRDYAGGRNGWCVAQSTNNGESFSTTHVIANTAYSPYVNDYVVESDGTQWLAWDYYDETGTNYDNVYLMVYDPVDGRWETVGGTALSIPLSKADADTYCIIVSNADSPGRHLPQIDLDSAGNPLVVYNYYDGTNQDLYCLRWNGSSWESAVKIADGGTGNIHFYMKYLSGAGAESNYKVLWPGYLYTTADGGANWSSGTAVIGADTLLPCEIYNGSSDTMEFLYLDTAKEFPKKIKCYPEPSGTHYSYQQGNVYTFQDRYIRSKVSKAYTTTNYGYYDDAGDGTPPTIYAQNMLSFGGNSTGEYRRVITRHNFNCSGWTGYHTHYELPSFDSINAYTGITFGTAKASSWKTAASNIPNDGIWLAVDTSGTKCDVSVIIAGAEVINDDDNAITASDFDIYVEKNGDGDVVTVKNGGDTIYTGTVPDSGQIDDATLNVFMGQMAVGGTSSAVYFDNVTLAEWSPTAPTWGVAGSEESLGSGQHIIMVF